MKTIYYVTHNPGKVEIFNNILKEFKDLNIKFEILEYDYPEDKSMNSVEHVAKEGAKLSANKFNKDVITTDTGLFITTLNGYPGINTAVEINKVGINGIINQIKNTNREAVCKIALGFCAPNKDPVCFINKIKGTVPIEPKGDNGFGFDSIFTPDGYEKTLAEDTKIRDKLVGYRQNLIKFLNWYSKSL